MVTVAQNLRRLAKLAAQPQPLVSAKRHVQRWALFLHPSRRPNEELDRQRCPAACFQPWISLLLDSATLVSGSSARSWKLANRVNSRKSDRSSIIEWTPVSLSNHTKTKGKDVHEETCVFRDYRCCCCCNGGRSRFGR